MNKAATSLTLSTRADSLHHSLIVNVAWAWNRTATSNNLLFCLQFWTSGWTLAWMRCCLLDLWMSSETSTCASINRTFRTAGGETQASCAITMGIVLIRMQDIDLRCSFIEFRIYFDYIVSCMIDKRVKIDAAEKDMLPVRVLLFLPHPAAILPPIKQDCSEFLQLMAAANVACSGWPPAFLLSASVSSHLLYCQPRSLSVPADRDQSDNTCAVLSGYRLCSSLGGVIKVFIKNHQELYKEFDV